MAEGTEKASPKNERKILSPGTWFLYSFILWSIVIVPLTMAAFFIFEISLKLFDLGNQYSAFWGLVLGLIISAIVSLIYSKRARDAAE
jgi:hypothetical protein